MPNAAMILENAKQAALLLRAMSNEKRLLILSILNDGERSVGELQSRVGLSQSALSQHLARLRRDNLVSTRRQAQTIFYSLNGDAAIHVMRALNSALSPADAKAREGGWDASLQPGDD